MDEDSAKKQGEGTSDNCSQFSYTCGVLLDVLLLIKSLSYCIKTSQVDFAIVTIFSLCSFHFYREAKAGWNYVDFIPTSQKRKNVQCVRHRIM